MDTTPPSAPVEPYQPFRPGRQLVAFIAITVPFVILAAVTYLSWGWIKGMVERFYQ